MPEASVGNFKFITDVGLKKKIFKDKLMGDHITHTHFQHIQNPNLIVFSFTFVLKKKA